MATATKKSAAPPSPGRPEVGTPAARPSGLLGVFDAVFRFLASLKLAVFCLAALAATLAYGTKFNSDYGMNAANEYIYQTRGFALLMAFLGLNVLCAALIRYPWTKRQTGFVITHAGLLVVIGGSWWAAQTADEGMVGMREGERSSKLIRNHKPTLYVKPMDPHTGQAQGEYAIPVHPGAFDWEPGRFEVVSGDKDPFKLAIKGYYAASAPKILHEADPSGEPMIKLRPKVVPPGGKVPVDVFTSDEDRWFEASPRAVSRAVRRAGPAQFLFTYVDRPELLDDFARPPADPGKEGVARLHYTDKAGKARSAEVRLDDVKPDQAIPLPDSDLNVSFSKAVHEPIDSPRIRQSLGEDTIHIAQFVVKKGDGPAIKHNGYAGLWMAQPTVPDSEEKGAQAPPSLLRVTYFYPPVVDPQVNQRYGQIEVMGDNQGRVAYRVFQRGNPAKIRAAGLLKPGQEVTAFGGDGSSPMTMTFAVEEFLQAGSEKEIYESIHLPPNKIDEALPAVLAELTVKGVTKEVWLQKSPTFDPAYRTVTFDDSMYEVAFDVDHLDLGFSLQLKDFDVGFDPGTSTASSYRSEVTLTDEAAGIKDKPYSIYMNHTLDHKGWRFFQTSYSRYIDPKTNQPTGEFVSVFQVAKNPARGMIYAGCIIVVLGAFVQFYMRAGIFTDGGHRQRERAAEQARKRLAAKAGQPAAAPIEDVEPL